ncbi:MAG TPA: ABC-type transport auxiliary lipoprotein family protein [Stenotrophomonas sp.]|nr:ABC-type transport auxiliary lipoprotein family protein [Stenotrophomonas sp.]
MKRLATAWLCLSLVALSGCSILSSGSREPVTIFAPDVRVTPDPAWPEATWQLTIVKPTASRLVDSPRINVRPTPGELQVYQGASWAQPATDMVEGTVVRAFEDSGRITGVGRASDGIRADYRLVLDLRRFESDYAGQALPAATVELNAKLLHSADQRVVASRTFLVAQRATATDVGTVALAFEQALQKATHELVGWTLATGRQDAAQLDHGVH